MTQAIDDALNFSLIIHPICADGYYDKDNIVILSLKDIKSENIIWAHSLNEKNKSFGKILEIIQFNKELIVTVRTNDGNLMLS